MHFFVTFSIDTFQSWQVLALVPAPWDKSLAINGVKYISQLPENRKYMFLRNRGLSEENLQMWKNWIMNNENVAADWSSYWSQATNKPWGALKFFKISCYQKLNLNIPIKLIGKCGVLAKFWGANGLIDINWSLK